MSIMKSIFNSVEPKEVLNPISQDEICTLMNTKKEQYYKHTYDARPIIHKLREELHLSDEVLSKFDLPVEPRTNCCNAISIMLYLSASNGQSAYKYLSSIHRSVKNVNKKLPDWLVRIYFDKSVYEIIRMCEENIAKGLTYEFEQIIVRKFQEIITSLNVEIYTYDCENFYRHQSISEKIRSLRFLILSDPTVNVCAIREADGYMTNLECHNLNIFTQQNDRLFYLPWLMNEVDLFYNNEYTRLNGYQLWLRFYKQSFGYDFFKENLNIYDLLAGMFTTKLKINSEFYFKNLQNLFHKIEELNTFNMVSLREKYPHVTYEILLGEFGVLDVLGVLIDRLNSGFDEIFLLDIYKEIISVPISIKASSMNFFPNKCTPDLAELVNTRKNSLFYANNILNIKFTENPSLLDFIKVLKDNHIIPETFVIDETKIKPLPEKLAPYYIQYYDSIILKNIIYHDIFNITIPSEYRGKVEKLYFSVALNTPYMNVDSNYDIEKKYLKYKQKYMNLKNKYFKNFS
jgi:hypothetical protein